MIFLKVFCLCFFEQIWDGNGISRCVNDIYPFSNGVLCYINAHNAHNKRTHAQSVVLVYIIHCIFLTRFTVLGFGASIITTLIVMVLAITERTTRGRRKVTSAYCI